MCVCVTEREREFVCVLVFRLVYSSDLIHIEQVTSYFLSLHFFFLSTFLFFADSKLFTVFQKFRVLKACDDLLCGLLNYLTVLTCVIFLVYG